MSISFRFWRLIPRKGAELRHMLLLNITIKPCMGSPVTLSHVTFSDLERSESRSLRFRSIISRKGAELGHVLLLNINWKVCMGSPLVWLNTFDFSDLERSMSRSFRFRRPISCKGSELSHVLQLDTNSTGKSHIRSPTTPSRSTLSDLERSKPRWLKFWRLTCMCCKWAKIGHMWLINHNWKPYMGSPIVWLYLTLVTLKGQSQGYWFESLYLVRNRVRP